MSDPTDLSPAERYVKSRERQRHPHLAAFSGAQRFGLDGFQVDACRILEEGKSVLVAAPTGAGKTIVGEFAAYLALELGGKCFYTTPIKALSNQKYAELAATYGEERVGLLTGDNSINGDADVVVMTTEVLRNMIYAGSPTLQGLRFVVMDEVHYLADRSRGAVWEEVIIHLPDSVAVAALSATVSNAEDFGEWLGTVRGETVTIVEERRPVPLFQHVIAGRRLYDLFADADSGTGSDPNSGNGKQKSKQGESTADRPAHQATKVNPQLLRLARDDWAARQMRDRRSKKGRSARGKNVGNGRRVWIPSRPEVVASLDRANLLPAIVFIFSRAGCAAAVEQCLRAGVRLTSAEERGEIYAYVESACSEIPDEDRHVLGYYDFLDGLTRGVAAHHAGMLPAFKECVEELFLRGLCRVVFATETLALGVNMPARSVVIEKLSKWNGETHADITPGEYTQLTGRAGRRGIDVEGHGVVLWQPGIEPKSVAGLASTRTYPLRSSFRPSYNMAVNLVSHYGAERARRLLESSFAQFQSDKAVVGLSQQLHKADEALAGYAEAATCSQGDFMEYAQIRNDLNREEKRASKDRRAEQRQAAVSSLERLRKGDVIDIPAGKFAGIAVVTDPGDVVDTDGPRPRVLTVDRQARRLSLIDFPVPVESLFRMRVPKSYNPRNAQSRRDLAQALRERVVEAPESRATRIAKSRQSSAEGGRIEELRRAMKAHPCHSCGDRESHARWSERWFKLNRDAQTLRQRVERRTNSIARQFDRVCEVLQALGYLSSEGDPASGGLVVTSQGRRLMRLYSEMDLVAAECLREGLWSDLDAAELAAALSLLVYEERGVDEAPPVKLPRGPLGPALTRMTELAADLMAVEKEHRLDQLRTPDAGFAKATLAWARGEDLDEVLRDEEIAAGDFVRWTRQVIDLAGQVALATDQPQLRDRAREAVAALRRGVVDYSPVTAELAAAEDEA